MSFELRGGPSVAATPKQTPFGMDAFTRAAKIAGNVFPFVHRGFIETYTRLRKEVLECVVQTYLRQYRKAMKRAKVSADPVEQRSLHLPKIYVTGHSLGGALAQLLSFDLASNCQVVIEQSRRPDDNRNDEEDPDGEGTDDEFQAAVDQHSGPSSPLFASYSPMDEESQVFGIQPSAMGIVPNTRRERKSLLSLKLPICCYTFGQPRVGNPAFAKLYKDRVPHTFRVANEGDAVTTMPTMVMCGGQYKHAGLEVMLDEGCTGNILVGPTVVETIFRFTKMRTSVVAHSLTHYRENLESGLAPHELHEYYRSHGIVLSRSTNSSGVFSGLPEWLTKVRRSDRNETL